jgi:recombinational DNA repair ATPase RecF
LTVHLNGSVANTLSEDLMATPLSTPNLTDYDAQLLELAHQLDAERREIILKFAQDLINIPYENEPELESSEPELSPQLLH